jgi:hypothetical protein
MAGQAEIMPGPEMVAGEAGACASRARLTIRPPEGEAIDIDPCAFVGKGGAVIDAASSGLGLAPAKRQENRLWTQPLYAPVPKTPKASKSSAAG